MKALLAIVGFVTFLGVANATVEVRILNTNSLGVTIADTGWVQCAGITCSTGGVVGNYFVTSDITTRLDPDNPFLDMNYNASTQVANPGTIIIEGMSDTFTTFTPQFEVLQNGNSTIKTAANTAAAYMGSTNAICPAGINNCTPPSAAPTTVIYTQSQPTPPAGFAYDAIVNVTTPSQYSLGLSFQILNPTSKGIATGDLQLDAVPEPTAVALFGAVVLFTVGKIRRRKARNS